MSREGHPESCLCIACSALFRRQPDPNRSIKLAVKLPQVTAEELRMASHELQIPQTTLMRNAVEFMLARRRDPKVAAVLTANPIRSLYRYGKPRRHGRQEDAS